MCGSSSNDPETVAPQRVMLSDLDPLSRSRPPPPPASRPSTQRASHKEHQPHTSGRERPSSSRHQRSTTSSAGQGSSSRRPVSSSSGQASSSRRPSSHRQPPKSSGGERHSSSHREHSTRDRPKSQFPSISEYPEDNAIISRVRDFTTLGDQHSQYYYIHDVAINLGRGDLDDPQTRHAAICRHIAKGIILSIISPDRNGSPDIYTVAREISDYLEGYSNSNNGQREAHLYEICKLGSEIRTLFESHPSDWEFGSWDDDAEFIILIVPALLKDDSQVIPRKIFRRP